MAAFSASVDARARLARLPYVLEQNAAAFVCGSNRSVCITKRFVPAHVSSVVWASAAAFGTAAQAVYKRPAAADCTFDNAKRNTGMQGYLRVHKFSLEQIAG
jgi:hypothetical protein